MLITPEMVMEHCEKIASYKKLQHVEIWQAGDQFPLTRSTKVDKLELMRIAETIIEKLRREGKWDA